MRTPSLQLFSLAVGLAVVGCSGSGAITSGVGGANSNLGGAPGTGGSTVSGNGGDSASPQGGNGAGGSPTGGMPGAGGAKTGGAPGTGGAATGGKAATGGAPGAGGAATGGKAATGGAPGTGGAATGGKSATGGSGAAGGAATGGAAAGGGTSQDPDCATPMPTDGTTHQYSGNWSSDNGTVNGVGWGMWAVSGTVASMTVSSNARAFSATWSSTTDFLAHVGLDWSSPKAYTTLGTITAQFVESKSGTAGSWSAIGIYGWMHSPCVEWYINEDSFGTLFCNGTTVTIDGADYCIVTSTTTGTGGANACESGHSGSWTNMTSTRKKARQCGTVTVSDHFAAWAKQGWSLGSLASVHINLEVGGGSGSIQFPVASVTTSN